MKVVVTSLSFRSVALENQISLFICSSSLLGKRRGSLVHLVSRLVIKQLVKIKNIVLFTEFLKGARSEDLK